MHVQVKPHNEKPLQCSKEPKFPRSDLINLLVSNLSRYIFPDAKSGRFLYIYSSAFAIT